MSPEELFTQETGMVPDHNHDYIIDLMKKFAKQEVITELEKHIVHPMKPGYRRHDILNKIKQLKNA
jgi:hypothetical protein